MNKKACATIIYIFVAIFLISCASLYGIKSPKHVTAENINVYLKKYTIADSYILQKSEYVSFLKMKSKDSLFFKNHTQPLQALIFENEDLISFHINCNAGGFPSLNWNPKGALNIFPPKTQTEISSKISKSELLNFLKVKENKNNSKYLVVLFWNQFLGKQTEKFLREFEKNGKLANSIIFIYINNDNLYL